MMPSAFSSFSISPSMSSCSVASLENCVLSCATAVVEPCFVVDKTFHPLASGPCGVRWRRIDVGRQHIARFA